jgi:hypothetical protein
MKIKIIITLSIAFIMTTCSKENKCGDGKTYYNLSENDKSQIPYKGNETLKFLSTSTYDTLIFNAEPEWSYYTNSKYYGADCPMENICQGRGIAFFNAIQNKKIVINQVYSTDGNLQLLELNYNDLYTVKSGFPFTGFTYDSASINGRFYHNIRAITGKILMPKDVGFWFTANEGIIKIYSNKGDTLNLIK